jgi:hypothetical protein
MSSERDKLVIWLSVIAIVLSLGNITGLWLKLFGLD